MAAGEVRIYRFGDFTLEIHNHCLKKGGQQIHLRPKAFETLKYLVERQGRLVKKDELLDDLWPNIIVTENTLSHCIDALRKALQDSAQEPAFIQTIPRLGFKFIAEVEVLTSEAEKPTRVEQVKNNSAQKKSPFFSAFPAPRLRITLVAILLLGLLLTIVLALIKENEKPFDSLAILPFINLNGDSDQDYFADGITEALIANLGKIKPLRVISRTSVMTYKNAPKPLPEIARELDVAAVVEGSVLRAGDRVRVTATLINAATDRHLWVKSYERNIQDILTLQAELAQAIANEIQVELTPQERASVVAANPVNPKAYNAYLKGRYFWNKRTSEGFEKAKQQFLTAIEHDSTCAQAYAGLADTYNLLANYGILPAGEARAKAKKYVNRALELDETLAEAHVSLAVNYAQEWDWSSAGKEFERAIKLNPNYETAHHWYAVHLISTGWPERGIAEMKKARELAPLSLRIQVDLGRQFYFARQYDQAIEQYRETLALEPNFASAHSLLGLVYLQNGLNKQALLELKKGMSLRKGDLSVWLGYAYAVAGDTDEALKMRNKWQERWDERHDGAANIALIYAGLGDNDAAFEWLEKAYDQRDSMLTLLRVYPYWDTLRADPRFNNLLHRLGLPETKISSTNKHTKIAFPPQPLQSHEK